MKETKVPFLAGIAHIEDPSTGQMIKVAARVQVPCGSVAEIDYGSSVGAYRCTYCNAIIGSVGMPKQCYDLYREDQV